MRQASLQRRRTRFRSALCANDVLGRCPRTPLHGQKGVGQRYTATPTSSRRFGASAQHKTISSTLQPFFHGLCPAPSPSLASCPPARRGQAVEILWAIRERRVHRMGHPRCCGWQLLRGCLASCRQAVDKRETRVSSNAALQRRQPPLPPTSATIRSPTKEKGYAKRDGRLVSAAAQLYNSRLENTASSQAASGR